MRVLAIDCATENCSAALFSNGELIDGRCERLGRGHAERLVPMIAELPDKGRADRVIVSLGPGSFTGVRIGLAAARALALVWKAETLGYPTLALIAAMAREAHPEAVSVAMTGGHGEWFLQDFGPDGLPQGELASLPPQAAADVARHHRVAGSEAEALVARRGSGSAVPLLPDARYVPLLSSSVLLQNPAPLYGRAPDAKLPAAS
ncbi:tRNA (adenosine(37)-N6)-threonylcarbamoyltransferase complex dimerization subunit type 1 TsaB [Altericroceibacterium xinjiangense]|uniref:tRNA (adenosine(37)-N6)-threonylcarbamoyltransferase complex dimerization subunit type 1 TsaB n=1 Tax=Altericroceibacterium xinjiangense TaxID=762261 RepID=UPI000F7D8EA6|nr:tRNA (adenosine(37)-N6)-threonylcarbamoyltransferase complex dimerization subunit type 1 TsaB [Altericroceibacterium xinjiangense]